MEKLVKIFWATIVTFIILFVFTPNSIVAAGGGGSGGTSGGYSSGISLAQREQIEAQLWNRVSEIQISAWNQDNSYFVSCTPGSSGCSSAINNPEPGAYSIWVSAWAYDTDTAMTVYTFNGNTQTVIRPGENFASVKLSLNPWQLVKIALPEAVPADETVRLNFTRDGYNHSYDMGITADGRIAYIIVPLSGTNFSLVLNGKTYQIPTSKIFGAIANNEPVSLVQLYVSVERLERYVRVPSEFSSIQAAVNFVPCGSTVLIEPGVYEEPIVLDLADKCEITLFGSPTYPRDVVIRSSAPRTVYVEGGVAKINLVGLTIQNDFSGRPSGEKWWSDAAITFDLGVIATLDHVVLESTGSGNIIAANYSTLKMSNVTLAGTGFNTGIVMYNNTGDDAFADWRNVFHHLLFTSLEKVADLENGSARIKNSVFHQVKTMGDVYFSDTNLWGDPEFIGVYEWNRFIPSLDALTIYWAIKKGDGNYPGALMPMRPYLGGKG